MKRITLALLTGLLVVSISFGLLKQVKKNFDWYHPSAHQEPGSDLVLWRDRILGLMSPAYRTKPMLYVREPRLPESDIIAGEAGYIAQYALAPILIFRGNGQPGPYVFLDFLSNEEAQVYAKGQNLRILEKEAGRALAVREGEFRA